MAGRNRACRLPGDAFDSHYLILKQFRQTCFKWPAVEWVCYSSGRWERFCAQFERAEGGSTAGGHTISRPCRTTTPKRQVPEYDAAFCVELA